MALVEAKHLKAENHEIKDKLFQLDSDLKIIYSSSSTPSLKLSFLFFDLFLIKATQDEKHFWRRSSNLGKKKKKKEPKLSVKRSLTKLSLVTHALVSLTIVAALDVVGR